MPADVNSALQATRSEVISALRQASAQTGSDFNYLLGTAMRESSLQPAAKSGSSSAAGLFQFVQQTWLGMVKQYGGKFGLASYADAIQKNPDGHYSVDNHTDREAILALRHDPKVSALMAGQYAQDTRAELQSRLGRDVRSGELYAAHFLGPAQACHLIELAQSAPASNAAQCFPAAASSNRSVFYHPDGSAKTVREVYDWTLNLPEAKAMPAPAANPAPVVPHAAIVNAPLPDARAAAALLAQTLSSGHLASLGLFGQPSGESSGLPASLPQPAFLLTPGIMQVLSGLDSSKLSIPGKPHKPG